VIAMTAWIVRAAYLVALFAGSLASARAEDLTDFNKAIESVSMHNRTAIGYLRTENVDLATIEVERLRDSWARFTERFAGNRPHEFDGSELYSNLFTGVSARLVGADLMLRIGRPDAARNGLIAIRKDFYDLREASGVPVLADCVRDANAAMDELQTFDKRTLDWTNAETGRALTAKASDYASVLSRCDSMAADKVRASPEFRRLVDGAKASLDLIPKAIATRDTDLLHRILIELRSFDNLLDFRFG
jgi:hypothetical protein